MDATSKTTQWAHSRGLLSLERVCGPEGCHVQVFSANAPWLTGAHGAIEETRSGGVQMNAGEAASFHWHQTAVLEGRLKCFFLENVTSTK